jgi:hypothetical protein
MESQQTPACAGCGKYVKPEEDGGDYGLHWHNTKECKKLVAQHIREKSLH